MKSFEFTYTHSTSTAPAWGVSMLWVAQCWIIKLWGISFLVRIVRNRIEPKCRVSIHRLLLWNVVFPGCVSQSTVPKSAPVNSSKAAARYWWLENRQHQEVKQAFRCTLLTAAPFLLPHHLRTARWHSISERNWPFSFLSLPPNSKHSSLEHYTFYLSD